MRAATEELQFTEEGHRYTLNGIEIPSVTQVIQACGLGPDFSRVSPALLDYKGELGKAVHKAVMLLLQDDLDWDSVAPEIEGYVVAAQNFQQDSGFKPLAVEEQVIIKWGSLICAGRLDARSADTITDFKTSKARHPSWKYQTAAYGLAFPGRHHRIGVQLFEDGTFRVHEHEDDQDYDDFRAMLRVCWLQRRR